MSKKLSKKDWTRINGKYFEHSIQECEAMKIELLDRKECIENSLRYIPEITGRQVMKNMNRINNINLIVADLDIRILDLKKQRDAC